MALRAFNEVLPDENAARAWLEKARWPHGPECPKCGSVDHSSWLKNPRRWNCMGCHHQFSVTAGTPMHRTHLPLLTWAHREARGGRPGNGVPATENRDTDDLLFGVGFRHRRGLRDQPRRL